MVAALPSQIQDAAPFRHGAANVGEVQVADAVDLLPVRAGDVVFEDACRVQAGKEAAAIRLKLSLDREVEAGGSDLVSVDVAGVDAGDGAAGSADHAAFAASSDAVFIAIDDFLLILASKGILETETPVVQIQFPVFQGHGTAQV